MAIPPRSDTIQLLGNLPAACVTAIRRGTCRTTISGVTLAPSGPAVVNADAGVTITTGTQLWQAQLQPFLASGLMVEGEDQSQVAVMTTAWEVRHADPTPNVGSTSPPLSSLATSTEGVDAATIGVQSVNALPIAPSTSLEELLTHPSHRRLVEDVTDTLALCPRTYHELVEHLQGRCRRSKTYRTAYTAEDIQAVVRLVAVQVQDNKLDLTMDGCALVRLDRFDSKRDQKQVANRTFPRLFDDPITHAGLLRDMELCVDRDIVLAVRSRGGGIMGGLASQKPAAIDAEEDNSDMEEENRDDGEKAAPVEAGASPAVQFTDMTQCPVPWSEGDLTTILPDGLSIHCQEILNQRRQSHRTFFQKARVEQQLPPLAILTASQADAAALTYEQLRLQGDELLRALERHDRVVAEARRWCSRTGPSRWSEELRAQLQDWWSAQHARRAVLQPILHQVQAEAYVMERELRDFAALRALGVLGH